MKKLAVVLVCLCVVFVTGFASYRGYRLWKQKHLVTQARAFIAKADSANALLCLRQALATNSKNLQALKLMADFAEAGRSPQAVLLRSRIVDLEPDSITNRLALARTAVAAGQAAVAQRALDGVNDAGKKTAIYQKVAGGVDLAARRFTEAEQHFSEAARLEPTNLVSQLNLESLRLQTTNVQTAASARAALQALCTNVNIRPDALRQLTRDSLRHTNLLGALSFSQRLLQDTYSGFTDRLLHLEILHAATNAQEGSFLTSLEAESVSNPAKAYEVSKWILASRKPEAALSWLKTLPPGTRTNLPVPMIEADCYIALKDWPGLLTNLVGQSWADLECLRLAGRARALREQGMATSAKTEWMNAVKATGDRLDLLLQLLHLTGNWNWTQEQDDLLWTIANRYPSEKWVIQVLSQRLFAEGNTRGLQSLFSLALQREGTNLTFMNNLASTALLLESWEKKPHELAREVFAKAPTNTSFVATYAYSLLVQKQPAEALKTMQQLTASQLEDPSIATYYGLILKSSGDSAKAAKYLELAGKAKLLPEELKLVDRARRGT